MAGVPEDSLRAKVRCMPLPRLRQAVLAASDPAPVAHLIESELGGHEPFHDTGVAHFGLQNAVYAIGDTFVEIVSPIRDDTAVGRHLDRTGGDSGYMAMFEVDDVDATRRRLEALGVRIIWDTAREDIVDLHLHPKDVGAAIVALDITRPVGSWRWGGPDWEARVPDHGPGGLRGLTVAVDDPGKTAARWADVLGLPAPDGDVLALDGGRQRVRFVDDGETAERIVGVDIATPGNAGPVEIAGVLFDRIDEEA